MTRTFEWGDDTGDSLTITYSATSGNQTIQITSDKNNTVSLRTMTITFTTNGNEPISKVLIITQQPGI